MVKKHEIFAFEFKKGGAAGPSGMGKGVF